MHADQIIFRDWNFPLDPLYMQPAMQNPVVNKSITTQTLYSVYIIYT